MPFSHEKLQRVKVSGESIKAFIEGLAGHRETGVHILAAYGIVSPRAESWYPIQATLQAYREIELTLGSRALFVIGEQIPLFAKFPKVSDTLEKALAALDTAYHMNHAIDGKPLYNELTGKMREAIGHYRFIQTDLNAARIVCDTPYPTYFDEGIIYAIAQQYHQNSYVRLDEVKSTRQHGGSTDEYIVRWF